MSINQPFSQSINRSISQSTRQSDNQSINQRGRKMDAVTAAGTPAGVYISDAHLGPTGDTGWTQGRVTVIVLLPPPSTPPNPTPPHPTPPPHPPLSQRGGASRNPHVSGRPAVRPYKPLRMVGSLASYATCVTALRVSAPLFTLFPGPPYFPY